MSKYAKKLKRALLIILCLLIACYLAYCIIDRPQTSDVCEGVELVMEDDASEQYISRKDVEDILNKAKIDPKGKRIDEIVTGDIERVVLKNHYVDEVHCYVSASQKLFVRVKQKTPIVYVIPEGRTGYYVDVKGQIISNTSYATNVMVATGLITDSYATHELLDFARFVHRDKFWNSQIEQMCVRRNKYGKLVVDLIPRVGDQVICLGPIEGYEKKLRRLRIFYDKAIGVVGWNRYSRLNLEYDNQIICTKK